MKIGLYITLEPEIGAPVTLARVSDGRLLVAAGFAAINEASRVAEKMSSDDQVLGELQRQEVVRLQSAMELVIPGFSRFSCIPGLM